MIRRLVLYPFLIAIYPIVSLYAHNVAETPAADLPAPIALAMAATLLAWAGLRLLLKDGHRAGLVAALALAVFYTVAHATHDLNEALTDLSRLWVRGVSRLPARLVVPVELAAFAGLAYLAVRRVKAPRAWTPPLNAFALVLVALPAGGAVLAKVQGSAHPRPAPERGAFATAPRSDRRPDIYYIILDGFGRGDVLREIYDFDPGPFLDGLRRRGFFIATASTSNYSQTRLSIASSLNAEYLDDLAGSRAEDDFPLRTRIAESRVAWTLKGLGYRRVTFSTGYDMTEDPGSDLYLSPFSSLGEFHRLLLHLTPLPALMPNPAEHDPFSLARARTIYILDTLPEVARRPGPKFTFAHILAPHPPFLFGPGGEDVADRAAGFSIGDGDAYQARSTGEYIRGYRGQVAFLTRRVLDVVDAIRRNSAEPPIIILQGDHGPGSGLRHNDPERSNLKERMSILNAYAFPGAGDRGLDDGITPVNSFRVLLDDYFGSELGRLPDRSYFSRWLAPYDFIDVTARVRPGIAAESARPAGRDRLP